MHVFALNNFEISGWLQEWEKALGGTVVGMGAGMGRREWMGLTIGNWWHFQTDLSPVELRFHRCMGKGVEDSGMMRFYNVVEHSYFIVEAFSFQNWGQSQVIAGTTAVIAVVLVLELTYYLEGRLQFTTKRTEVS